MIPKISKSGIALLVVGYLLGSLSRFPNLLKDDSSLRENPASESNIINADDSNNVNADDSNNVNADDSNNVNADDSNNVNADNSKNVNSDDSNINNAIERSLEDILAASGSDKISLHHYEKYYRKWLEPYRHKDNLKMLEIGAKDGKSLECWSNYFGGKDHSIYGLAYGESSTGVEDKFDTSESLFIVRGDQSKKETIDMLCDLGPFDVIIDDGSHVPSHQVFSFFSLFQKCLKIGGLYVVEDIETNYWNGNRRTVYDYPLTGTGIGESPRTNAVEKFKQLVDVLIRRSVGFPGEGIVPGDEDMCSITFGENILSMTKCAEVDIHARKSHGNVDNEHFERWMSKARATNPPGF